MSYRAAAGFFCVLVALAQSPPGLDKILTIDAVVTDAGGRAVSSLKPSDFTVSLDDRPQEVTNCLFVNALREARTRGTAVFVPQIPAARGRRIVLMVDDLNLSVEGAARVRLALRRFVSEQMQDGDSVIVITSSEGNGVHQRFTSDPRSLQNVIELVRSRRFTDSATADSLFSAGTLGMVRLALNGLRDVAGRKSMVIFTEAANAFSVNRLDGLLEMANRAFTVVYVIDARAPGTTFTPTFMPAASSAQDLGEARRQVPLLMAGPPTEAPGSVLATLAAGTGGMFLDRGDILAELAEVLIDQSGYYLIQYRRDFAVIEPRTGERLVEKIVLKVRDEGLRVRSRNGFPPNADDRTLVPANTSEKLIYALDSPFSSGGIRMSLSPIFYHSAKEGSLLVSLLHIDGRDLTFVKTVAGLYRYGFDTAVMTLGSDGESHTSRGPQTTGVLTEEEHQAAIHTGFAQQLRSRIEGGSYQVRVAVSDSMSGRVGTANQFVEVPEVGKGDLALSSINLVSGPDDSAGELRLKHGDEISFKYDIYNLARGDRGQSEIESRTRLIHESTPVVDVGPTAIAFPTDPDPAHRSVRSHLAVNRQLPPGDYMLHILVTDKLAENPSPRTASRHIFFKIVSP